MNRSLDDFKKKDKKETSKDDTFLMEPILNELNIIKKVVIDFLEQTTGSKEKTESYLKSIELNEFKQVKQSLQANLDEIKQ